MSTKALRIALVVLQILFFVLVFVALGSKDKAATKIVLAAAGACAAATLAIGIVFWKRMAKDK